MRVVLDEAQDLNRDTLEAIRMLSNFETPAEKLVQIVLAGQPRLADTLKQPDCEQIRQRLNVIARLAPLSRHEVQDYIAHRLKTTGTSASLFAPDALQAIASASGGVPRNVNIICFNSLTLAYALSRPRVGREEVAEVLRDLDLTVEDALALNTSVSNPVPLPQSIRAFARGFVKESRRPLRGHRSSVSRSTACSTLSSHSASEWLRCTHLSQARKRAVHFVPRSLPPQSCCWRPAHSCFKAYQAHSDLPARLRTDD